MTLIVADAVPILSPAQPLGLAGWTLIISAVGGALVSVINAIANGWGRTEARNTADGVRERLVAEASHIKDTVAATAASTTAKLDTADRKLDIIHDLTNSTMTELKAQLDTATTQLATALNRIDALETLLQTRRTAP